VLGWDGDIGVGQGRGGLDAMAGVGTVEENAKSAGGERRGERSLILSHPLFEFKRKASSKRK